jgi:hypothetical protein
MNGARRAPLQTFPYICIRTLFCPRIPGYLTHPRLDSVLSSKFLSLLPYTRLCDITSRLRPVLTIQRALLFLVDQEAVPLMTLHLSAAPS